MDSSRCIAGHKDLVEFTTFPRFSLTISIGKSNAYHLGPLIISLNYPISEIIWRSDSGNQWNGGYSRGQGYNNGYANQDSNMYATAAAAVPGAS
ncbi:hypothetical protein AtNW77_Chr1g0048821 [Arabidopsis thaliana]